VVRQNRTFKEVIQLHCFLGRSCSVGGSASAFLVTGLSDRLPFSSILLRNLTPVLPVCISATTSSEPCLGQLSNMIEPSESSKESTSPRPRPTSLNAAMTKDLYKNIPAPKPRRTHSSGLSGIVGLITEHLKKSPPPCLRQPSPQTAPFTGIMHPAKHAAFINSESNRSSSASIAEDQRGDSFNPSGMNLANNSTHSTEGPQSMLAEFCAAPFLGDRKSESGDLNLLFASAVGHRRGGKRVGEYNFTISSTFRRSLSLQGLSSRAALVPCMIPMPAGRPYHDLSDALESIPKHSWILPYVIACTPPEILGQLLDLPFLIEGQSHTHTTATTITRSRAHTISFDIDPLEPENTTFSVPLNMKHHTLEGEGNDHFPAHHDPIGAAEKTDRLSFEDWNDFSSPYAMPLRESPPHVMDRASAESPVDDLPVTRARGHTHTGSAYEPDPSLFLPYPLPTGTAATTARSSLSRAQAHDAADFVHLVRMSSASPRLGGGSHSNSFSHVRGTPSAAGSGKHSADISDADRANVTPPPPLTALLGTSTQDNNTTESSADAYGSRIQLLAPAPVKIPAIVGGLVPPSRTPSPTVSAAALGLAAQTVHFPSSWRSLGIVWLSADPKWNVWHPKIVFLLDNYLLECTAVGTGVIGFTQLSGAIVEKKIFHYNARKHVSPLDRRTTTDTGASEDDYFNTVAIEEAEASPRPTHTARAEESNNSSSSRTGTGLHGSRLASFGLKITCFTTSAPQTTAQGGRDAHSTRHPSNTESSGTHSYWLTTHDEASLDLIAAALQRATQLTFEDVFDVQRLTGEDSLLGQGKVCCFLSKMCAHVSIFLSANLYQMVPRYSLLLLICLLRPLQRGASGAAAGGPGPAAQHLRVPVPLHLPADQEPQHQQCAGVLTSSLGRGARGARRGALRHQQGQRPLEAQQEHLRREFEGQQPAPVGAWLHLWRATALPARPDAGGRPSQGTHRRAGKNKHSQTRRRPRQDRGKFAREWRRGVVLLRLQRQLHRGLRTSAQGHQHRRRAAHLGFHTELGQVHRQRE